MTILDFAGQPPVVTDDAERISTLIRKGWTVRPDPTPEQLAAQQAAQAQEATAALIKSFTTALEQHYDATAQQRRYDDRYTCALRAGYPGPFQAEGLAFATWMDDQNAYAYTQLAAVMQGQRAMPASPAALVAELKPMVWPV